MVCVQCGASLRPQARFCNTCGAEQPRAGSEDSQPAVAIAPSEQPPAVVDADTDDHGDGTGKQKRPPRIPRHRDEEELIDGEASDEMWPSAVAEPTGEDARAAIEPEAEPAVAPEAEPAVAPEAEPEKETMPAPEAASGLEREAAPEPVPEPEIVPVVEESQHDQQDQQDQREAPMDDAETLPETPTALPISEMPTLEQPVLAPISAIPQVAALDEPLPPYDLDEEPERPSQPAMPTPTDGLPWPLPPTIIVGGRYRIEELVRSSQAEYGPENVYRAHDLQAYEQCWSCGAHHEIATALDPYCDQCGADMLAREFIMIERLTSDVGDAGDVGSMVMGPAGIATEGEARIFTQGLRTYYVAPKAISAIHFPMGVHVSGYVTADHGRTRQGEVNEDSTALVVFDAIFNSRHVPYALGIVADGLGGHDSGQEASKIVVRTMLEVLVPALIPIGDTRSDEPEDEQHNDGAVGLDGETMLRDAARAANVALCAANDAQQADMGSTLVAALIVGDTAWIANMGDSRGYVYDDHGLRRVTKDHSLVEQLIDAGMIPPEERYQHPQRNQILKSLGAEPRLEADIFPQELRPGVRILLCSDGVWEMVRDDELARILRETTGTAETCERIVRAANENGGEDNISVVLLDVSA